MSSLNCSHFCFQVLNLIISFWQTEELCVFQSILPHVDNYRFEKICSFDLLSDEFKVLPLLPW